MTTNPCSEAHSRENEQTKSLSRHHQHPARDPLDAASLSATQWTGQQRQRAKEDRHEGARGEGERERQTGDQSGLRGVRTGGVKQQAIRRRHLRCSRRLQLMRRRSPPDFGFSLSRSLPLQATPCLHLLSPRLLRCACDWWDLPLLRRQQEQQLQN